MINSPDIKPNRLKLPTGAGTRYWKWLFSFLLLMFIFVAASHAAAQSNGISAPAPGETLAGVVTVTGTAVHSDYLRYELAFLNEANPAAGWIVFAEGSQQVTNGVLAIWDTTVGQNVGAPVFPDGRYQLRLRVVKTDYNYDEYFVTNLTISNAGPTPTPTPDETALAVTLTAVSPGAPGNTQQTEGDTAVFSPATPLPSLTPFPTPTPPATPLSLTGGLSPTATPGDGGVLGQLEAVDTTQFSRAFWGGVRLTAVIFGLMALYVLLRSVGRRLWRRFWVSRQSGN
ncbi:MAG: hypothetical protein KJ069_07315 [Anaerolineae bacterium]|nr:hypothetical protein [Anaerolineae bacterium]